VTGPTLNAAFPHTWTAEILPNRPLILPSRQFVYPAYAEEIAASGPCPIQTGSAPSPAVTLT